MVHYTSMFLQRNNSSSSCVITALWQAFHSQELSSPYYLLYNFCINLALGIYDQLNKMFYLILLFLLDAFWLDSELLFIGEIAC